MQKTGEYNSNNAFIYNGNTGNVNNNNKYNTNAVRPVSEFQGNVDLSPRSINQCGRHIAYA